jgi:NhaP-type Na+/H+ or K+/H+ antiporter
MFDQLSRELSAGGAIVLATLLIFAYSVVGKRLGRWNLTAPILFTFSGWVIFRIFDSTPGTVHGLKILAEATLALVLFTDAAGVRPSQIEGQRGPVSRLLLIALPLTILAGTLLALVLWPEMSVFTALLLAAIVAPTDAALGAAVVVNKAVPVRIRRILNVESGVNDGLATPVVFFAVAAVAGAEGLSAAGSTREAIAEIALGALIGAAIGIGGGLAVHWSTMRRLSTRQERVVAVLTLPLLSYALAVVASGNGFIAAFVAGTCYAAAWRGGGGSDTLDLAEDLAQPMGDATWLAFGMLVVPVLLVNLDWREAAFALAALTVLRMVPVALSLMGSGFRPPTVLFVGWFGPRGLASVVFALIALESLELNEALEDVLATATLTIIASVILHGITAGPGARAYGAWVRQVNPAAEVADSSEPRGRGRIAHQNEAVRPADSVGA